MVTRLTKWGIVFAGIAVLAAAVLFFGIQYYAETKPDMTVINTIKENMKSPGKFYAGETTVCVESVDDLGYICTDRGINLHYGKLLVNIPYKALADAEYLKALKDIGIEVYTRKDENDNTLYKLTYWGDAIVEWSRVE